MAQSIHNDDIWISDYITPIVPERTKEEIAEAQRSLQMFKKIAAKYPNIIIHTPKAPVTENRPSYKLTEGQKELINKFLLNYPSKPKKNTVSIIEPK